MVCYFTNRAPLRTNFKDWVAKEIVGKRGWAIDQVKFSRWNFYLIIFSEEAHRDAALDIALWYMDCKFMYTISWEPAFDIQGHYNMLPVWIDFPFRAIALETIWKSLVERLGKVLVYHQGDKYSEYPNDRACILWDITLPPPKCLKVKLAPGIDIW